MPKKTSERQFTEQEQRFQADYEWARHDPTIRTKYRGQVIAVREQTVIAAARTLAELEAVLEREDRDSLDRAVVVPIGM